MNENTDQADLLAACKRLVEYYKHNETRPEAVDKIKHAISAIAKVESRLTEHSFKVINRIEDIPVQVCTFVDSSDLFAGLDELRDKFCDSNPPFSWGDNNRTLETAEAILNHLGCRHDDPEMDGSGDDQLVILRKRCEAIGLQTYDKRERSDRTAESPRL